MLDLILVRLISQYDTKKRLFLNCTDTILIHNPSVHFPAVHDSYFVSLPMTRHDESYLHLFTLKKPNLFNQNDTTSKEIVITVISALSPRKSFSKTLLSSPIAIDYVAFPFFFSVTSSFQNQLRVLNEREILPFIAHNNTQPPEERSCVYGHNMAAANELKTAEFKRFWEALPAVEKRALLAVDLKDVVSRIRESVYWFVLRYVLANWSYMEPNNDLKDITKKGDCFLINNGVETEEVINRIISGASTYDYCVTPSRDESPCHVFSEPFEYTPTSVDDQLLFLTTLRFKMFLFWMVCDQMDSAYQMKRREAEADRVAALLLNEGIGTVKETKTKKRKKNKKNKSKKEAEVPVDEIVETVETVEVPKPSESNALSGLGVKEAVTQLLKEPPKDLLALLDLERAVEEREVVEEEREKGVEELDVAAQRVNQFLLGEKREKAEVQAEKKKNEEAETPFVSLRCVMKRQSVLEQLCEKRPEMEPSAADASIDSIIPSLASFQAVSSLLQKDTPVLSPVAPVSSALSPEGKKFTATSKEFVMHSTPKTGSFYSQSFYTYSSGI